MAALQIDAGFRGDERGTQCAACSPRCRALRGAARGAARSRAEQRRPGLLPEALG